MDFYTEEQKLIIIESQMKKFDEIHEAYHRAKEVLFVHYGEQWCEFCDKKFLMGNWES